MGGQKGLSIKSVMKVGPYILLVAFLLSLFSLTILQEYAQTPQYIGRIAQKIVIYKTRPNVIYLATPNLYLLSSWKPTFGLIEATWLTAITERNISKEVTNLSYPYIAMYVNVLPLGGNYTKEKGKLTEILLVPFLAKRTLKKFSEVFDVKFSTSNVIVNTNSTLNSTHTLYLYYVGKKPSSNVFAVSPLFAENSSRNLFLKIAGSLTYEGIGKSWKDPLYPKEWGTTTVLIAFVPDLLSHLYSFEKALVKLLSRHFENKNLVNRLLPWAFKFGYAVSFSSYTPDWKKDVQKIKEIILKERVQIKVLGQPLWLKFIQVSVTGRLDQAASILNTGSDMQILMSFHWQYFLFYVIGILLFSVEIYKKALWEVKRGWEILELKGRNTIGMKASFYLMVTLLAAILPVAFYEIVNSVVSSSVKMSFLKYYALSLATIVGFFIIQPFVRRGRSRLRYFFMGAFFVMISLSYIFDNWGNYVNLVRMAYGITMIILVGGSLSTLFEIDDVLIIGASKRSPESFEKRELGYHSIKGMAILAAIITSTALVNFTSFGEDFAVKTNLGYPYFFVLSSIPSIMEWEWWIPLFIIVGASLLLAISEILRNRKAVNVAITKGIPEEDILSKSLNNVFRSKILRFYVLWGAFTLLYLLIWDFVIWESYYFYATFGGKSVAYVPPRLLQYLFLSNCHLFAVLVPIWIVPLMTYLFIKMKYRRDLR